MQNNIIKFFFNNLISQNFIPKIVLLKNDKFNMSLILNTKS